MARSLILAIVISLLCGSVLAQGTKISELPEATSPAQSDVLPIVSGAATKKVQVGTLFGKTASLLPATAGSGDIGSGTKPYQFLFWSGSSSTPGSNNFKFGGTSTSGTRNILAPDADTKIPIAAWFLTFTGPSANRTFTVPDASTTLCGTNAVCTGYAPATSGTSILKGNGSGGFSSASSGTDYVAPGVDMNTSNQVVATHLSSALPINQGGTGTGSTLTGLVRGSGSALTGAELSGDCTTSGSNAITCTKTSGSSFGTAATQNTGTSGATIGLLNGANTVSGFETHTKGVVISNSSLTDNGSTIGTDASLSNNFRVTALTANVTLSNPTNSVDGQIVTWEIIQNASAAKTLAFGTNFAFGAEITACTISTTLSSHNFLTAIYNSTMGRWLVRGCLTGY